jgi:hypothetical protein
MLFLSNDSFCSDLSKVDDRFKIPNLEVMTYWARWIISGVESWDNILQTCVEGPVSDFTAKWPNFMQQQLDAKLVGKARDAVSHKTLERIYHVLFWGLMQSLGMEGWKVSIEPRAASGGGYVDIRLCHRKKHAGVLIKLKSSEKKEDMARDADKALNQIEEMNYRNPEGLPNIHTLREYGIAAFHLSSYIKGRYLELNGLNQWVEKDDPMMRVS